jgi:hypothetical protein
VKGFFILNVKALSHIFVIGGLRVAAFIETTRHHFKLWLERDDEIFKACEDADSLGSVVSILNRCRRCHFKTWVLDAKNLC